MNNLNKRVEELENLVYKMHNNMQALLSAIIDAQRGNAICNESLSIIYERCQDDLEHYEVRVYNEYEDYP